MLRRSVIAFAALSVLAVALDLRRPPNEQLATRVAIGAIHGYQAHLSRVYARMGVECRFTPSCSHYGEACIQRFGLIRGGWLAAKRIVRCGPWTPKGTVDPPPTPQQTAIDLHR
jgi:putative membrane protein insertion efficiency factor